MQQLSSINSNIYANFSTGKDFVTKENSTSSDKKNDTPPAKKPYFSAAVNPTSMAFIRSGVLSQNNRDFFQGHNTDKIKDAGLKILAAVSSAIALGAGIYIYKQKGKIAGVEGEYIQQTGRLLQDKASKICKRGRKVLQEAKGVYKNSELCAQNIETLIKKYSKASNNKSTLASESQGLISYDDAKGVFHEYDSSGICLRRIIVDNKDDKPFVSLIEEHISDKERNIIERTEEATNVYMGVIQDSDDSIRTDKIFRFINGKLTNYSENQSWSDNKLYQSKTFIYNEDENLDRFINGLTKYTDDDSCSFAKAYKFSKDTSLRAYCEGGETSGKNDATIEKYIEFFKPSEDNSRGKVAKYYENDIQKTDDIKNKRAFSFNAEGELTKLEIGKKVQDRLNTVSKVFADSIEETGSYMV